MPCAIQFILHQLFIVENKKWKKWNPWRSCQHVHSRVHQTQIVSGLTKMNRLGLLFEALVPSRTYSFSSFLTSNLFATNASRQVARRRRLILSGKYLYESKKSSTIIQIFRERKWQECCWSSRLQDTTRQTLMDIFDELLDPSRDDTRQVLLYI